MAIVIETSPPQSVQALEEGLSRLGLAGFLFIDEAFNKFNKFIGVHTEESKHLPHQVYALRLDRLAEGGPLEEAKLLSWRYIVGGTSDSILSADVRVGAGQEHVFSEFSQSRIANETVAQLDKVAADKSFSQEEFNPRLLRVFGLMFAALWLHRQEAADLKDDIFIPLPGASDPLTAGKKYSRDELAAALHKEAKEQIKLIKEIEPEEFRQTRTSPASE
jgi:hypothetical protein